MIANTRPSLCAPLPAPAPNPLPPTVAQGIIAALTLAHAGVIGYALHHEGQDQAQYIGELITDDKIHALLIKESLMMLKNTLQTINLYIKAIVRGHCGKKGEKGLGEGSVENI